MSQESKLRSSQNHTRPDVLEGHFSSQNRTLAVLLEQAFRIREEVAAGLQSSRDSVQVEAVSRKLLENHILTITRIVKQLSMGIQTLERQIIQRDSVISGTTLAVQNLEQKNTAGIGDLRGRVARCDASISKLSADVSSGEQQVNKLQKEVAELKAAVGVQLKELEVKFDRDLKRQEASFAKHSEGQRSSISDLYRQVKLLADRMSGELKEAKEQTDTLRKWMEQRLNSSIQIHAQGSQQLRSLLEDKTLEVESRLANRLLALEVHAEQFEKQQSQADRSQYDQLKRSEAKLSRRMTSVENSIHQELQLLKQEYHKATSCSYHRAGFLSVCDAVESLRQINGIKSKEKL